MQPFRLRLDARDWFRDLRNQDTFKIDFDAFYFCLIAGLAAKRKKNIPIDETAELVDYFPEPYRHRGKLLVGLFIELEMDVLGVSMKDRNAVHSEIARLVTPESPNYLSNEGVREFNKYAHGGYDRLLEWFEDRPRSLETFLRSYKHKIDESIDANSNKED